MPHLKVLASYLVWNMFSYSVKNFLLIMQATKICSVEILIDKNFLHRNFPDLATIFTLECK